MAVAVSSTVFSFALILGILFGSGRLPAGWDPFQRLTLSEEAGPATRLKLRFLLSEPGVCQAMMARAGNLSVPDRVESAQCHLRDGVRLTRLSEAALAPVETRCGIALRLWFWERGLQDEAQRILGSRVAGITHFSSYSCRPIRSPRGTSTRMSQHATANAIDIAGFRLADGRLISLVGDWAGDGPEAEFLRAAHRLGCHWFPMALGPDYNAYHNNHFHFDAGIWQTCL
ncbi:MAG: extensin family protein [Pseudomonadota bacterium]